MAGKPHFVVIFKLGFFFGLLVSPHQSYFLDCKCNVELNSSADSTTTSVMQI
jgi:hypothetical protein